MRTKTVVRRSLLLFLVLLCLATLGSGCRNTPQRLNRPDTGKGNGPETEMAANGRARVTFYLEVGAGAPVELSLRLVGMELGNGRVFREVPITRMRFKQSLILNRQIYLGSINLDPGNWSHLRLTFSEITINGTPHHTPGAQNPSLILPITGITGLKPDSSSCIFIDWPGPRQPGGGDDPLQNFSARFQTQVLARDQAAVVCREIGTIYQVSPDRDRVTAALGLPAPLGEAAFDIRRRRFYVTGTGIRALHVIDADSNRVVDTFSLPMTRAPAALLLSRDLKFAFISDTSTNRILKLDLDSGFVVAENLKLLRPGRLFLLNLKQRDYLGVISIRERNLTLLDPETLKAVTCISINGVPAAAAALDNKIHISDQSGGNVMVYGFPGGRLEYTLRVGRQPGELLAWGRRIYVTTSRENYLSVLVARQRTPLRRIDCGPGGTDLAIARNWRKLYVTSPAQKSLTIIDLNSGRFLRRLKFGGSPDQVVIRER